MTDVPSTFRPNRRQTLGLFGLGAAGLVIPQAFGGAAFAQEAAPKGQIVLGFSQEPTVFNPHLLHIEVDEGVYFAIFDPLFAVDDKGNANPADDVLYIADSGNSQIRMIDRTEVLSRRGSSLELCRLRQLFQLPTESEPARQYVVEVMAGTRHLGLVVDMLQGQQDIIIRPLGRSLNSVRGFSKEHR